ncbi:MAG: TolC family protein [Nitrospinae bacterium]|nr:TolC family protein [Nitrospinota bacterium]
MRPNSIPLILSALFILAVSSKADSRAEPASGGSEAVIRSGERLSVQNCVEIALERQPAMLSAAYAKTAAESRVGEARAIYYPQLNLFSTYSQSQPVLDSLRIPAYQQYSVGAALSQTFYDFGRTSSQVNAVKYSAEAAGSDVDNVRINIILGVKAAYYAFLQSRRNVEVAKETVSLFQAHLDMARSSFAVGERARYDVTKAEVDLSNAGIALIHARNAERVAKVGLDTAIGVKADYEVVDDLNYKKYSISLDDALKKAFENRPDVRALSLRTQSAEKTKEAARSGYLPVLAGSAQYSSQATMPDSWALGVTLTVPIFSGFSTKYAVNETLANYNSLVSSQQQLSLTVYNEVSQAYLNMAEAEETIPASELSVRLARENMDIAEGRYKEGVGTSIEVSDAQTTLSNARLAHIQSLLNYKLTRATLEKAIGGIQ